MKNMCHVIMDVGNKTSRSDRKIWPMNNTLFLSFLIAKAVGEIQ